jgi:hypothetical protein
MTYARVVFELCLYFLEQCLNPVLWISIKTCNFVTFYEFLIHLGMHPTTAAGTTKAVVRQLQAAAATAASVPEQQTPATMNKHDNDDGGGGSGGASSNCCANALPAPSVDGDGANSGATTMALTRIKQWLWL